MDWHFLGMTILILGILFMTVEIFIPSFGIAGGIGLLCMSISIIMMAQTFEQGLFFFVLMLVGSAIFLYIGYKIIGNSKLTLKENLKDDCQEDLTHLVGKKGQTKTALRPSGKAELDGTVWHVLTKGEFVEANRSVVVTEIENRNIIVRRS